MQPNNLDSEQPTDDQPQNSSSMNRIIQPLSSENDIRRAAEIARVEQQKDTFTAASNVESPTGYEQSALITEPIHRPPQPQPPFRVASSQPLARNDKNGKTIFIVVGLVIVTALAIGASFFLFNSKIAASDLVQGTVQQTTFLRPKQWHPTGTDGTTFGDLNGKNGKSLSAVSIKESQQASPLTGASDAMYEQLRIQLVRQTSVASIEPAFRNTGEACKSDIALKVEQDTKKTKTAIGLSTIIGSCTREDGDFTIKIHTVAGISDGQIRAIAVGARNVDWDTNSEAFQAILDSVGQVSN